MGFLSGLFKEFLTRRFRGGGGGKGRKRGPKGKIEHINAWKKNKKLKGNWVPYDEYVKGKRGR